MKKALSVLMFFLCGVMTALYGARPAFGRAQSAQKQKQPKRTVQMANVKATIVNDQLWVYTDVKGKITLGVKEGLTEEEWIKWEEKHDKLVGIYSKYHTHWNTRSRPLVDSERKLWSASAIKPLRDSEIVIPAKLGGRKVTSIGPYAFLGCFLGTPSTPNHVIIPNGVESIEAHAFDNYGRFGFPSITIPASVKVIKRGAFVGPVKSITVDPQNPNFKVVNGILYSTDGKRLIKLSMDGIEDCINIPQGVVSIDDYALGGLKIIKIPPSVKNIGQGAFSATVIELDNPNYKLVDGILYSKDGKRLITAQDTVKNKNSNLVIPEGVISIEGDALWLNGSGRTVTIPASVKKIGKTAFGLLDGTIIFKGPPPTAEDIVEFNLIKTPAKGYYPSRYKKEWEAAIQAKKWPNEDRPLWGGLIMEMRD